MNGATKFIVVLDHFGDECHVTAKSFSDKFIFSLPNT